MSGITQPVVEQGGLTCIQHGTQTPCFLPRPEGPSLCQRLQPPYGHPRRSLKERAGEYDPGLVSVLIPCLNAERYVARAIRSALDQTYERIEVVVVDDGSTDASRAVVDSFGDAVRVLASSASGACSARNDALEASRGEYIQFLDADDMLLPDAVGRRLAAITDEDDAVFGDRFQIDECDAVLEGMSQPHSAKGWGATADWLYVALRGVHTAEPLHRRRAVCEVGGFDESLPQAQEADLHLRLLLGGFRMRYLPGAVVLFRHHSSTHRISMAEWWEFDPDRFIKIACQRLSLLPAEVGTDHMLMRAHTASLLYGQAVQLMTSGNRNLAFRYADAAGAADATFRPHWVPRFARGVVSMRLAVSIRSRMRTIGL